MKQKSKKLFIMCVGGVILAMVLAMCMLLLLSKDKERELQKQLDFGEKYLNELDYEKAIAAYEKAIEIDPMNIAAYLGLAEVYMAQEEYESAMQILQRGYELTDSQVLYEQMLQLEGTEDEPEENEIQDEPVVEEIVDEYEFGVPAKVVEGIMHNGYMKYDLSEADEEYLRKIIALMEAEDFEGALSAIDFDKTRNIVESLGLLEEKNERFPDEERGRANVYFDNKKVFINVRKIGEEDNDKLAAIIVLPINEGMGYGVSKRGTLYETYMRGECKEGVFWGEFIIVDDINEETCVGTAWNGLFDGEITTTIGDMKRYETFERGLLIYWDIVKDDYTGNVSVHGSKYVYSDGSERIGGLMSYGGFTVEQVKSMQDGHYYSLTDSEMIGNWGLDTIVGLPKTEVMIIYPW